MFRKKKEIDIIKTLQEKEKRNVRSSSASREMRVVIEEKREEASSK